MGMTTCYLQAGYVGEDVESILYKLLTVSGLVNIRQRKPPIGMDKRTLCKMKISTKAYSTQILDFRE